MAKVNITADTETGTMEVSINGESIKNVSSVSLYPQPAYAVGEEDKVYVRITTREENEETDVSKFTEYTCCNNQLVPAVSKASEDIANFILRNQRRG
jgi:hypothetical protein